MTPTYNLSTLCSYYYFPPIKDGFLVFFPTNHVISMAAIGIEPNGVPEGCDNLFLPVLEHVIIIIITYIWFLPIMACRYDLGIPGWMDGWVIGYPRPSY